MSNSTRGRIPPYTPAKTKFNNRSYRGAIHFLLEEFCNRCAYSMQHTRRAGGLKCIEVDHFDPALRHPPKNFYGNLLPATRHCNGAKSNTPSGNRKSKNAVRLLNPRLDQDYGEHIREDRITHELVGVTPSGSYHILVCDLNAPHLVNERTERAVIARDLQSGGDLKHGFTEALVLIQHLRDQLSFMIPPIPYFEVAAKPS